MAEAVGINRDVETALRDVALAMKIKGDDRFQVAAYERAADGVRHTPHSVRELWQSHRLTDIPGVGGTIAAHLDEWFRTGHAARFDEALAGIPDVMLDLVRIPGVGPATARKLAAAGVEDLEDAEQKIAGGALTAAGFTPKALEKIAQGLAELLRRSDRMLLPAALSLAEPIVRHLRASPAVDEAVVAGSIRRRAATAGNIDLVVASPDPAAASRHAASFPGAAATERDGGVELALPGGQIARVWAAPPERFGAALVWHTGSIVHNDVLAERAAERDLTLTPNGVRDGSGLFLPTPDEEALYGLLGLAVPPPELREGWGEMDGPLPRLVEAGDLRGDCHSHTTWSDGRDSPERMLEAAIALGREYLCITDHSYPNLAFARRAVEIEQLQQAYPRIKLVNGLEVNITVEGGLQVPNDVLAAHQFCLASIHTGFRQPRDVVTQRLLAALSHPSINGIAHPTGRLLLRREGVEADWEAVFDACLRYDKFLEIDGPADRLDLPDELVREAVRRGVKLTIDSDAHAVDDLHQYAGGIDVARRGRVEARHVLNALPWDDFRREARVRG